MQTPSGTHGSGHGFTKRTDGSFLHIAFTVHFAFSLSLQVDAQFFGTEPHNRKWNNKKGSFPEKWVQSVFSLSHRLGKLSKSMSALKCDCYVTADLNVLCTNVAGFPLTSGAITDTDKHTHTHTRTFLLPPQLVRTYHVQDFW